MHRKTTRGYSRPKRSHVVCPLFMLKDDWLRRGGCFGVRSLKPTHEMRLNSIHVSPPHLSPCGPPEAVNGGRARLAEQPRTRELPYCHLAPDQSRTTTTCMCSGASPSAAVSGNVLVSGAARLPHACVSLNATRHRHLARFTLPYPAPGRTARRVTRVFPVPGPRSCCRRRHFVRAAVETGGQHQLLSE